MLGGVSFDKIAGVCVSRITVISGWGELDANLGTPTPSQTSCHRHDMGKASLGYLESESASIVVFESRQR